MISHVELRSEESNDIKPYVYGRNVEKIIVPLSEELKKTKQQFVLVKFNFCISFDGRLFINFVISLFRSIFPIIFCMLHQYLFA